jgi:hypothetical protein
MAHSTNSYSVVGWIVMSLNDDGAKRTLVAKGSATHKFGVLRS